MTNGTCDVYIRKSSQVGHGIYACRFFDIALVIDGKTVAAKQNIRVGTAGFPQACTLARAFASEHGLKIRDIWTSEGRGFEWETLLPVWAGGRRSVNPVREGRA